MKKKIAMSLVVASMLVFAGCGNSNNTASTVSSQVESSAVSEAAESESAAEENTE